MESHLNPFDVVFFIYTWAIVQTAEADKVFCNFYFLADIRALLFILQSQIDVVHLKSCVRCVFTKIWGISPLLNPDVNPRVGMEGALT